MYKLLKRLWQHIAKRRKKQLGLITILMIIASVSEVISIGAVVPFLGVLANPEIVFQHESAQQFVALVGVTEPNQMLLPFTVLFAVAALIAGSMRILLLWQTRLAHAIGADLSFQIYKRTLYQPYSVHVARNSSEIIAGISSKANQVVGGALIPVMTMMTSFVMVNSHELIPHLFLAMLFCSK